MPVSIHAFPLAASIFRIYLYFLCTIVIAVWVKFYVKLHVAMFSTKFMLNLISSTCSDQTKVEKILELNVTEHVQSNQKNFLQAITTEKIQ